MAPFLPRRMPSLIAEIPTLPPHPPAPPPGGPPDVRARLELPVPNDTARLPMPNPQVIHRSLPDGAVLFSTVDEVYFGLNAVASRVWELLPPALTTLGEVCETLQAEYPDVPPAVIRADVVELLDHLRANALVVSLPGRALHVDAHATPDLEIAPAAARRVG